MVRGLFSRLNSVWSGILFAATSSARTTHATLLGDIADPRPATVVKLWKAGLMTFALPIKLVYSSSNLLVVCMSV